MMICKPGKINMFREPSWLICAKFLILYNLSPRYYLSRPNTTSPLLFLASLSTSIIVKSYFHQLLFQELCLLLLTDIHYSPNSMHISHQWNKRFFIAFILSMLSVIIFIASCFLPVNISVVFTIKHTLTQTVHLVHDPSFFPDRSFAFVTLVLYYFGY